MNPSEEITINKEDREDLSFESPDEDLFALGVCVSEDLWEEVTVKAPDELIRKLGSKKLYRMQELKDGNVVFVENRSQNSGTNSYAYRVNREECNNNVRITLDPCINNAKEIQLIWEDSTRPNVSWNGKTRLFASELYIRPAPDMTVLTEVEAYSLATTMKI